MGGHYALSRGAVKGRPESIRAPALFAFFFVDLTSV
jgi:hypothetical protein